MSVGTSRVAREGASALDAEIHSLLGCMISSRIEDAGVIPWSSPVPVFGDITESVVATVGLNPSNREFVDQSGRELDGPDRRFHTLRSLGLHSWAQADKHHIHAISTTCQAYFTRNPYDTWFKALDRLIEGTGASFYASKKLACHLDLVPFATIDKWTTLSAAQRAALIENAGRVLANLICMSNIHTLILNGATVVREVQNSLAIPLEPTTMPSWKLKRTSGEDVQGLAYFGMTSSIAGIPIGRQLTVLGCNHNIQSSFGVTRLVRTEIARWIMSHAGETM